jgi:hypothetical protein
MGTRNRRPLGTWRGTYCQDAMHCLEEYGIWEYQLDWSLRHLDLIGPVTHSGMDREERREALGRALDEWQETFTSPIRYLAYFGAALVDLPEHSSNLWRMRDRNYVSRYWGDWTTCDNCDRTFEVGEQGDAGGDRDLCERCLEDAEPARCRVCGGTRGMHRIVGCNGESIDA